MPKITVHGGPSVFPAVPPAGDPAAPPVDDVLAAPAADVDEPVPVVVGKPARKSTR